MDVTTFAIAPYTHWARDDELVCALDSLFRDRAVPPTIVQHSFVDRRPTQHYVPTIDLLTPYSIRPSSELLEDIGRVVAPAQTRFTTLLGSNYPPVFPPVPAETMYASPNEDAFVMARSQLERKTSCVTPSGFQPNFESALVINCPDGNQPPTNDGYSQADPANPNIATITIGCPALNIATRRTDAHRHAYALHSLTTTVRQDPSAPAECVLTPHFSPRDPRFERMCNGLRYECTWVWEVLDERLRADGFADSESAKGSVAGANGDVGCPYPTPAPSPPTPKAKASSKAPAPRLPAEHITVTVPLASQASYPLCITFTATLTSTAGLDAIDAVHRTSQWADTAALEGLQRAFDKAHLAVQVVHHVVRVEILDVGEMVRARLAGAGQNGTSAGEGPEFGVYAPESGVIAYSGQIQIDLDRDAGVVGRRGDEDEEENSDEEV